MRKVKIDISKIIMIIGVALILLSLLYAIYTWISLKLASIKTPGIVDKMYEIMPEIKNSVPDGRANVIMPSLEIDGQDFVGIIKAPAYDTILPIAASWNGEKLQKYPCRYFGSMYDSTLIIGGSDSETQLDFLKIIAYGDLIYITDTMGERYCYSASFIKRTDDVSTEYLQGIEGDLVLFVRNTYSLEYIVVGCKLKSI